MKQAKHCANFRQTNLFVRKKCAHRFVCLIQGFPFLFFFFFFYPLCVLITFQVVSIIFSLLTLQTAIQPVFPPFVFATDFTSQQFQLSAISCTDGEGTCTHISISYTVVCQLLWCFEPSQPQRVISGLKTNFSLSPSCSAHKSQNHKILFYYNNSVSKHFRQRSLTL